MPTFKKPPYISASAKPTHHSSITARTLTTMLIEPVLLAIMRLWMIDQGDVLRGNVLNKHV